VRLNDGLGDQNNTYITNAAYVPQSGEPSFNPFAGNFCALTDQNGPGLISMYQDVFVPASVGSVSLSWADRMRNYFNTFVSEEPPLRQEYRVEIRSANNAVLAVAYRTEPGDPVRTQWAKRSFDLTPYKGQVVRVVFLQEQWRSFFHLYYDNVSVRVRDTGPVAYDVFFGTNAVPGSNEFRGTITTGGWALPQLLPQQTYFWRVNTRLGTNVFAGPVWRFTTAPVGPLDHFTWESIPSPQSPGAPFTATVTARDAAENLIPNFEGQITLSGNTVTGTATNNLLGEVAPSVFSTFENSTVGYSFTPNTDLLVVGFRQFSGAKVSLWTDGGSRLGPQLPIQLQAGRTYRLGLYSPNVATNYLFFDGLSTFAHGTLHESYEGAGDAFPTNSNPARWWLVDLIYSVPSLGGDAITPNLISLSNGVWSSPLSIANPALIQLRADDAQNHSGLANIFNVRDRVTLKLVRSAAGELSLRFSPSARRNYHLETSATLAPNSWSPFGSTIPGTGAVIDRPLSPGIANAFFRLQVMP